MYVRYVRPFKFRRVYPLQFLVHFNTRARAVKPTSCIYAFLARWSRGMVITLSAWRAFLLSPTMNLDGKRGFSGEENVSGSKEPAEENTAETRRRERERERAIERVGNNSIHSQTGQLDIEAARQRRRRERDRPQRAEETAQSLSLRSVSRERYVYYNRSRRRRYNYTRNAQTYGRPAHNKFKGHTTSWIDSKIMI